MFKPRPASRAFLDAQGWEGVTAEPLAGDASFRKYFRLQEATRRAVLMDAPPPLEDVRPFVTVGEHLTALGLSAPLILGKDIHDGFLLLEDFGDATFTRALAGGADETALYELAVDTLIALHKHPAQTRIDVPAYDVATLDREVALLPDWFLPEWTQQRVPLDNYLARWRAVYPLTQVGAPCLVLRDYHVDNLVQLPARAGIAACGLLDFQDARIGVAAYDLASLVEDARRDIAPALKAACIQRYLAAFPTLDRAAFETALTLIAAQRNAKIIGIFVRLARRDGKPHYLTHLKRVWRLLTDNLRHPALADLKGWFDAHVPHEWRTAPPL